MAQIHELESKSRFGTRYIVGTILAISTLLIAGWIGFFVFLPIKSGMSTVYELEERFLPRAEGMVLDFVSLSEPSIIITSDNIILDELHDGLNRDPIKPNRTLIREPIRPQIINCFFHFCGSPPPPLYPRMRSMIPTPPIPQDLSLTES